MSAIGFRVTTGNDSEVGENAAYKEKSKRTGNCL